jgi:hypothetical protein
MAGRKAKSGVRNLLFRNKLVLHLWALEQFGVAAPYTKMSRQTKPWDDLKAPLADYREGIEQGHHLFLSALRASSLFPQIRAMTLADLDRYDANIVEHTETLNRRRRDEEQIVWKYYQWLELLFTEYYLDRYFNDADATTGHSTLLADLNGFVERFNAHCTGFTPIPQFEAGELNKVCIQCATGSGKTLMMHVNYLQYRQYAEGKQRLSRVYLITPSDDLSQQHERELHRSGIPCLWHAGGDFDNLFGRGTANLDQVNILEITKLQDKPGPTTVAADSLGDENLVLVDEGHRGMSAKDESAWMSRRNKISARGFTFEYSATFEQAVIAAKSEGIANSYAKSVLFNYSYGFFYDDGFGKDFRVHNLPRAYDDARDLYLTACLLRYYQQLYLYETNKGAWHEFNLEKPMLVFVGSRVLESNKQDSVTLSDVAQVIDFFASFLNRRPEFLQHIRAVLHDGGREAGLLDEDEHSIFTGAFAYLAGRDPADVYRDILARVFHHPGGGRLRLERLTGESGEVKLYVGDAPEPFGLVYVGDAKGMADHCEKELGDRIEVHETRFGTPIFGTIKQSQSPVNLLVGARKFIEGWDCWRVSTMGLMHFGQNQGSQVIQLFGRGVRLKGHGFSLKRSAALAGVPSDIAMREVETLNIFGIDATFMAEFRKTLEDEGLRVDKEFEVVSVPLKKTYDQRRKLKVLKPKKNKATGEQYNFKKDGPTPVIDARITAKDGDDYADPIHRVITREMHIVTDWYPRIETTSRGHAEYTTQQETVTERHRAKFHPLQLHLLDRNRLFFAVERYKRQESLYNLSVTRQGIEALLLDDSWYTLVVPEVLMRPNLGQNLERWHAMAIDLLEKYCRRYHDLCHDRFIKPRMMVDELQPDDPNFPKDQTYDIAIPRDQRDSFLAIIDRMKGVLSTPDTSFDDRIYACVFSRHLYSPLFREHKLLQIAPLTLNTGEYRFVQQLIAYWKRQPGVLFRDGQPYRELYLLRNLVRRGTGFPIEARSFYPDFIMWIIDGDTQYVTFIDPHGMQYEDLDSEKVNLFTRLKQEVEPRFADQGIKLNSFIISTTEQHNLKKAPQEYVDRHVLFPDDNGQYIDVMVRAVLQE